MWRHRSRRRSSCRLETCPRRHNRRRRGTKGGIPGCPGRAGISRRAFCFRRDWKGQAGGLGKGGLALHYLVVDSYTQSSRYIHSSFLGSQLNLGPRIRLGLAMCGWEE